MGQSIVQIRQMGDALRSSGYKSIDSALAEIIDNSIEAKAHDVFVIMNEHLDPATNRRAIYEFGILDNGSGMDYTKLASCLGIGYTTRAERRGMGRFGVGLPQASLHVTPTVEVFSWQDEIEPDDYVQHVWLDINKVKTGEQEEIEDPKLEEIPVIFRKFLKYRTLNRTFDFTKHGTLVYWKECDNVKPKTMAPLLKRLEFTLGRKFRHLIASGEHNIRLITIGHEPNAIDVLPNDPLFLMKPNYVLGNLNDPANIDKRRNLNCTEAIFEPYATETHPDGVVTIPVGYVDKKTGENKTSDVKVTFSRVRAEFYDQTAIPTGNPGQMPIGQHAKELEGISIVRANREIDFGTFDFYDRVNNPYHRWWGCEISFDPVLDELFGVANNKQQVELRNDKSEDEAERGIWETLAATISSTIKSMVEANKELRKGSRTGESENTNSPTESIIESVEHDLGDSKGSASEEKENTSSAELEERARQQLIEQGVENPTADQIRSLLRKEVSLQYANIGRNGSFIDTDFRLGNVVIKVNTAHIFYNEFIAKMNEENKLAFELFIGALAKAIDKTNLNNSEQNDELIQEWDHRLKSYLKQIRNN